MLKIKELMHSIGSDFRNSYQKMIEYRQIFHLLHEDLIEFEICPSTRWTYLRKTGCKLIKVLYEIILFYENHAERHLSHSEKEDVTALGGHRQLKDLKLIRVLHVSMDILEPVILLNTRT